MSFVAKKLLGPKSDAKNSQLPVATTVTPKQNLWELVGIGGNWWELVGTGGNRWESVGTGGNWWELVGTWVNYRFFPRIVH